MTLSAFITFILLTAVQTASPGPVVSLLVSTGLRDGRNAALAIIPGVLLGDLLLIIVAFAMTTALAEISSALLDFIKLAGGAYLVYLGAKTLQSSRHIYIFTMQHCNKKVIRQGFFASTLNPKGILFFVTFLPQFITTGLPYNIQFAILGATFLAVGLITDTLYAITAAYGSRFLTLNVRRGFVVVAGVSLLGTGIFVLAQHFR